MKYLYIFLFPLVLILSCTADEPTPLAEIQIMTTIGPLCPVENAADQTPCGYTIEKLNEIYSSYTLKILTEKDGSEVFSSNLQYATTVVKELPMGNYSIQVNDQTTTVNTNTETFVVSSLDKKVIELNIDTGIR